MDRSKWKRARFDQMADCVTDRVDDPSQSGVDRYVGLEHLDPSQLRIQRWGHPTDVESTKLRFEPGDIIFGKRRAYQRKLAVADFRGICSAHAMVLRANHTTALPSFLAHFCRSDTFFDRALSISVGGLSPTINWRDLARQVFILPPLGEQARIAAVLDELMATENSYADSLGHCEVLAQSMSDSVVDLIVGHKHVAIGELSHIVYGLTLNAKRAGLDRQEPYLRVANVQRGTIDLHDLKSTGVTDEEAARYALEPGDVVVVEGHAVIDEIGRAAVWTGEKQPMLHQNHLIRIRCGGELLPGLAEVQLNSTRGRAYFRSHAKSTSGLNTINSTVVRGFPVFVPPVTVQERFVERLRVAVEASAIIRGHLNQVVALRESLATLWFRSEDV